MLTATHWTLELKQAKCDITILPTTVFCFQDEPSQHDSYFLEEGSRVYPPHPPVASSSTLRSSQSVPQRSVRVDLSQDVWSGVSQSLSQSSQGRLGASQASQPKKKKSRMGFWFISQSVIHTDGECIIWNTTRVRNNSGNLKTSGWTDQPQLKKNVFRVFRCLRIYTMDL